MKPDGVPLSSSDARAAAGVVSAAGRKDEWTIVVIALVSALAAFAWTLGGYFVGDDFGYVGHFSGYPLAQWPRLFVHEWSEGIWGFGLHEVRPFAALSYITDALVWGANPFGFRLTNLLLHASCSALAGLIAWRASARDLGCGLAAAVLFALHPVHAEPVAWITGRVDILPTVFYLGTFLAWLRYREQPGWRWLAVMWTCFAAAAFSKEFGLTVPLMLLAADLSWWRTWRAWRKPETWTPYAGFVVVVLCYRTCRKLAFGGNVVGALMPDFSTTAFWSAVCKRQLTYLGHLFPPLNRWFFEGAPIVERHAPWVLGLVVAIGIAACFVWWKIATRRAWPACGAAVFFAFGWYLVATLPLSITYVSARHLYLASAGVCIAMALVGRAVLRSRAGFAAAVLVLAALGGNALVGTTRPWRNAGLVSRDLMRELAHVEREVAPGSALLLDVPEIVEGAYVWTWAVPFAVRPPFMHVRLDERLVVFENPGASLDWGSWHEQAAVAALTRVEVSGWLVQAAGSGPARRLPLPAEKLREAAKRFAANPKSPSPHGAWRKLVDEASVGSR